MTILTTTLPAIVDDTVPGDGTGTPINAANLDTDRFQKLIDNDVELQAQIDGLGSPTFRGASVTISAPVVLDGDPDQSPKIPFDTIDFDTDDFFSTLDPSVLTIPAGVNYVVLTFHTNSVAYLDVLTSGNNFEGYITNDEADNGTKVWSGSTQGPTSNATTENVNHMVVTGPIAVQEGDKFNCRCNLPTVNSTLTANYAYFSVQVVG